MIKKGYLKRIVVKQPNLSQSELKLANKHDFLILDKETVYLGRSENCDLIFKEKIISRNHVLFKWSNDCWTIECLNDKNGVFLNGKLLKKNQVKQLEDNYIISLGPNFVTDYIFQFTTKEFSDRLNQTSNLSIIGRVPNKRIPLVAQQTPKITTSSINLAFESNLDEKLNEFDEMDRAQKKNKQLKAKIKRLEHLKVKLKCFKKQRKESKLKFKKLSSRIKVLRASNKRIKKSFINLKSTLKKERTQRKELIGRNETDQESQIVEKDSKVSIASSTNQLNVKDDQSIVTKYNEMFSQDFTCGVCLELLLEPVSATCGHSFCKFCINEWLKRNFQSTHNYKTCPLCRTKIAGFFKNLLIENIIEKYLTSADEELLDTRKRLIEERAKVVEKSNNENNDNGLRLAFDLDEHIRSIHDDNLISLHDFMDDSSSSIDEDMIEDEIDYDQEYLDSDFSDVDEDEDLERFDFVLN